MHTLIKIFCLVIAIILIGVYIWKSFHKCKDRKELLKDLMELFIPLILVAVIFRFVIGLAVIRSASMEPTLMTGNTVFINRLCYLGQDIQRCDIVIFESEEYGRIFGKRVIGLPGDKVEFQDGHVLINGRYLDESAYLSENIETICTDSFCVPPDCVFLLGDNRENSNDSRFWKNPYIPFDGIMGRYMGQIKTNFFFKK